jgi:hypothetical protein
MDPRVWGQAFWPFFHHAGETSKASLADKLEFLKTLNPLLPCPTCGRSFCDVCVKRPLKNAKDFGRWIWELREDINKRKKRPGIPYKECQKIYGRRPTCGGETCAKGLFSFLAFIFSLYPQYMSPHCKVKPGNVGSKAIFGSFLKALYKILRTMAPAYRRIADLLEVTFDDPLMWMDSSSLLAALWMVEAQHFKSKISVPERIDTCVKAMTKPTRVSVARRLLSSSRNYRGRPAQKSSSSCGSYRHRNKSTRRKESDSHFFFYHVSDSEPSDYYSSASHKRTTRSKHDDKRTAARDEARHYRRHSTVYSPTSSSVGKHRGRRRHH